MLVHKPITGSTNADVGALGRDGAPHGTAVWADEQTDGRGRLGRTWESPPTGNVYLSVLLRPALPLERAPLLCLAAAVVAAEVAGPHYRIKWPNDVQAPDGRKVAGILAELEVERGALRYVVVGIGLNVNAAPDLPSATSLLDVDGVHRDREELVMALIRGLLTITSELERAPDAVLTRWRRASSTLGKHVRIGSVEGEAIDIDPTGALVVSTPHGVERVFAGDVEMVRRHDA